MKPLTEKQGKILHWMLRYTQSHGFPPSYQEIQKEFGLNKKEDVVPHLVSLERKGWIRRPFDNERAITFVGVQISLDFTSDAEGQAVESVFRSFGISAHDAHSDTL